MGVTLRVKKYSSGTNTFYLDIWHNNQRTFEFLDIKFKPGDSSSERKEKKELADKIRAKRQLELDNYQHGFIPKHRRRTNFNDYYNAFLSEYKKSDKRIFKYSYEKFSEYTQFRRIDANQINRKLLEGFKDFLESKQSGLTGETPYDYFSRFKRVIKKAFREGIIDQNTFLEISELSISRTNNHLKKQILTIEELRQLKNTPCGNEEVKRAFIFACFTGLGEAEIRKLTWSRILKEDKIAIFREKSGEQIINDLPKAAIELLGKRGGSNELVFNLPSNVAIHKNLKNWVTKAGIEKKISFYCGRHTFAVQLLKTGANLKSVADCLGQSSTRHTVKYLNYVDDLKSKAIANLPLI